MISIALGILLGLLIGVLIFAFGMMVSCEVCNFALERFIQWVGAFLMIGCAIAGGIIGCSCEKHAQESYINQFTITKEVIESSVTNEAIGGLERVELVKQAVSENIKLVKLQYDCKQWYGFCIPEEVLELEPIDLGGS